MSTPAERASNAFLEQIMSASAYRGQVVYHSCQPARAARYGEVAPPLSSVANSSNE